MFFTKILYTLHRHSTVSIEEIDDGNDNIQTFQYSPEEMADLEQCAQEIARIPNGVTLIRILFFHYNNGGAHHFGGNIMIFTEMIIRGQKQNRMVVSRSHAKEFFLELTGKSISWDSLDYTLRLLASRLERPPPKQRTPLGTSACFCEDREIVRNKFPMQDKISHPRIFHCELKRAKWIEAFFCLESNRLSPFPLRLQDVQRYLPIFSSVRAGSSWSWNVPFYEGCPKHPVTGIPWHICHNIQEQKERRKLPIPPEFYGNMDNVDNVNNVNNVNTNTETQESTTRKRRRSDSYSQRSLHPSLRSSIGVINTRTGEIQY